MVRAPRGRILSYTFPKDVAKDGLYCEFGGMRFAVDSNFPKTPADITDGHVLVQHTILALGLESKVVDFLASDNRLYYLRGTNVYENELNNASLAGLPYNVNTEFTKFLAANKVPAPYSADNILGAIAGLFAPGLGSHNKDRPDWCNYYAGGEVRAPFATRSFPEGTLVSDMGYWNLLYDQLGDEGFDYVSDGTGYTSNVINWNSADAMQANNDYGSTTTYKRLDGGYGLLFDALRDEIAALATNYPGSGLFFGHQLTKLIESESDGATTCTFQTGTSAEPRSVKADQLFLAMPRRSLELVAANCEPTYMLNEARVKYRIESSIDQPAMKIVMVFDEAWWTWAKCKYRPHLVWPTNENVPDAQKVGGDTITDLPLRMVYYFGNNVPGGPGLGAPYVLLASYDDMSYTGFWHELETSGAYSEAPSLIRQPLNGPTRVPVESHFASILLKQLADAHGIDVQDVPLPRALYFQDWGQDPYGGGYHGWSAHYNICQSMDVVRAPYQRILGEGARKTYIVGSCYSFDQAWVEGAFCTAESVLQEFVGLSPLNSHIENYALICRTLQRG